MHKEKHCRRFGQDGTCKDSLLEQDTQKMKWKLALRIATSPIERWLKKAAEWNPDLSSRYGTNRAIGRPRKRWEDDINDFFKQVLEEKEKEEPIERRIQTNNNWINIAKDWRKWALLEGKLVATSWRWRPLVAARRFPLLFVHLSSCFFRGCLLLACFALWRTGVGACVPYLVNS